ncbi:MAG: potassium transporter Kup [Myxococcales bacterium]
MLALSAVGVVYGDIGTSPLYAMRECFHGPHAMAPVPGNILGVLSLIFWSLVGVITVKYLVFVMRADNRGEGGILALMALALQSLTSGGRSARKRAVLVTFGLFGGALLYGDGVITPAISVLSAVEGLNVVTDVFEPYVLRITVVILIALFVVQRKGTSAVGAVFGPFTLVWFIAIGTLGLVQIVKHPAVLAAISPLNAVRFFADNGFRGFYVLGSVFLVVTGGEALYADMGHFGKKPIRLAWYAVVLPALLLNYFGQGALLMQDASAAESPFYLLAPSWLQYPLVALATGAACIAAQAVISGAYSLTRQAVQLGYSPRIDIVHTSEKEIGQIYVPALNWALLTMVLVLVLTFRTSSNLAAAYGIAVSTAMVTTTVLAYFVASHRWKWHPLAVLPFIGTFLFIDLSFFSANILKLPDGGWFPLALAAVVFTLMTTWKRGREILAERLRGASFPLELFLKGFETRPPVRVPGTAVFMTGNPEGVPTALLHNLKHNKVLHERVVLLTITTAEVPHIPGRERLEVKKLEHGLWQIIAQYGFMETPNVPEIIGRSKDHGLEFKMMDTTFFLGRETLIPTKRPGMAIWREALFAWMSRNARSATSYFKIPPNRVVELGSQIEL